MATLVLTVAGAAIGGPIGAQIGAFIGSQVDQRLIAPLFAKTIKNEGPRLSDLAVQVSSYGQAIPRLYGTENRIAGNIIWSTGLVETKTTTKSGGKGAPKPKSETTTYSYSTSFAVAVARGTIRRFGRIWADGKLFRDTDGQQKQAGAIREYLGTEDQMPDALMQAALGVDGCPAHRGLAYIVFEDLQLADFGNRVPLFTFEVDAGGATVGSIAADLCEATGLEAEHFDAGACETLDVRGYAIARPMSARGALEPLRQAFFFDVSEIGGELVFAPATAHAVVKVPRGDLAAHAFGSERPRDYDGQRVSSLELPREVLIQHMDPERDYQANAQRARRALFDTEPDVSLELPIGLLAGEAKGIAERILSSAWLRRDGFKVTLPARYLGLEPSDKLVIPLDNGRDRPVRLVRKTTKLPGIVEAECETDSAIAFSKVAVADTAIVPEQQVQLPGSTFLHMMDLPTLRDEDDGPGFYAAAGSWRPGWVGAVLYRSTDGGTNYEIYIDLTDNAVQGTAQDALSDSVSPDYWDEESVITVSLLNPADTLEGLTEDAVLSGGNAALIGDEVVQFRDVMLIGPGSYELRGFLRGRKGTEDAIPNAVASSRFVMLSSAWVRRAPGTLADIGLSRHWKPVSIGETLAATSAVTFTDTGRSLKPYAPAHVAGERDGSGNLTITWVRRSRLDGSWRDHVDVPLGEESEAYQVDVMDGADVVRTIAASSPTAAYSAADQTADFGSLQASVTVRVFQMSASVGRGLPSEESI